MNQLNRTLYCEDSYIERAKRSNSILKCNGTLQLKSGDNPIFSYDDYAQEVTLKFQKEREERVKCLMQNNKSPAPIEYYTDEVLKQELFSLYGEMDESSPKFKSIFENYKIERLEQLQEWMEEEQEFSVGQELSKLQLLDANVDVSEDKSLLMGENSPQKKFNFKNSIHDSVQIEPFLLPRKKKICNKQTPLQGLVEFDPEIQLEKVIVPPSCHNALGYPLVEKIVKTVMNHPHGISCSSFAAEIKKIDKTAKIEEIMAKFGSQLVFIQEVPDRGSMFFPLCLQGLIVSPIEMFENIWHKMKIVVNIKNGIVKVSEALDLCSKMFGWNGIPYSTWGFSCEAAFIQYLIDYWRDEVKLVSELQLKPNGKRDTMYLVMVANEKQKRFLTAIMGQVKEKTAVNNNTHQQAMATPVHNLASSAAWNTHRNQPRFRQGIPQGTAKNEPPIPQYHPESLPISNSGCGATTQGIRPPWMYKNGATNSSHNTALPSKSSSSLDSAFPALNAQPPPEQVKKAERASRQLMQQQPKSWNKLF